MYRFIYAILLTIQLTPAMADITVVKIGQQEWTTSNLSVTTFRNGDPIPQAKNLQEWQDATENYKPVWCYPDFNEANAVYGKIYNYYAMSSEKKICPEGYHVPTPAEWVSLVKSVNTTGKLDAGRKLKSKTGWKTDLAIESIRKNGTDDFGFAAQKGGFISCMDGKKSFEFIYSYTDIEAGTSFWANSTNGYNVALGDFNAFLITNDYSYVQMHDRNWREGYFVRCIKNGPDFKELPYFPNKLFTWYNWMTENLCVKNFRNGEAIPYAKNKKEWAKFAKDKTAACCSVNFDPKNDKEYGLLYNWYAVNDSRILAPEGWRVPTYNEWGNMFLKSQEKNPKMENWASEKTWKNRVGTNESGFNGKAAGKVNSDGSFDGVGTYGWWWHSDIPQNEFAYAAYLNEENFKATGFSSIKESGLSVRCIK